MKRRPIEERALDNKLSERDHLLLAFTVLMLIAIVFTWMAYCLALIRSLPGIGEVLYLLTTGMMGFVAFILTVQTGVVFWQISKILYRMFIRQLPGMRRYFEGWTLSLSNWRSIQIRQ